MRKNFLKISIVILSPLIILGGSFWIFKNYQELVSTSKFPFLKLERQEDKFKIEKPPQKELQELRK